ncbi:hypothetical protein [Chondromyces apiculatus]|nr:hypothetical protein [Chondromyces apiculatus]
MRLTGLILSLACASTARAADDPQAVPQAPEGPKAPLQVATEPPPPPEAPSPPEASPPPEPQPPAAVAVPPPHPPNPDAVRVAMPVDPPRSTDPKLIGGWGIGALAPIVSVARGSAPFSFTWFGVSLLAYSGRGWLLPPPNESGHLLRFGGRLSVAEAMPLTAWPLDVGVEYGQRLALGADNHLYLAAGLHGSAAVTTQHELNVLHLPEASFGYQRHGRAGLVEIGGLGGLSVIGRYAVGTKISEEDDGSYFASTHTLRPYVGAHASVLRAPVMVSLLGRRTFLFEGDTGRALDHVQGMACWQVIPDKRSLSVGGCVTADVFHGEVVRVAPAPGPGGEMVSLRVGLNVTVAQVVGP